MGWTVGRERDNPPADAEQTMGRLDFRRPHQSEEGVAEEGPRGAPSDEGVTEEPPRGAPNEEGVTEEPPRGPPEWLKAAMEAEMARRETEARRAMEAERARREAEARKVKEAEERARAEAERRLQKYNSRLQEYNGFKKRFAEAERRLERRLGRVEVRVQSAQELAAWAEHVAGLRGEDPGRVRRTKGVEPQDDGESNRDIDPSQPPESAAENGDGSNVRSASFE
jgi:hypothetical protein